MDPGTSWVFHPHTGVWIETTDAWPATRAICSFTPIRGCGLKPSVILLTHAAQTFHPHTGVWIETHLLTEAIEAMPLVSPPYGGVD